MLFTEEIKKKKKKLLKSLLVDYSCLTEEEIMQTLNEIRSNLRRIFRHHIGESESISPTDLFQRIFNINPQEIDIFKRQYWWNIIRLVIRQMRTDGDVFIINKRTRLFVLQSDKELTDYKNMLDRDIKGLLTAKDRATNWVREQKWRLI